MVLRPFAPPSPVAPWRIIVGLALALAGAVGAVVLVMSLYVDVPADQMLVLTRKTGLDLPPGEVIAPSEEYKGVQKEVRGVGRHFLNPWTWSWEVVPQVQIPDKCIGVRIRLYGEDLPYGEIMARRGEGDSSGPPQKGIVPEILLPSRYPINAEVVDKTRDRRAQANARRRQNYTEIIEIHDEVTVPSGFRGVVTNITGEPAKETNSLVTSGGRGVLSETVDAGFQRVNPYEKRVTMVDCRSQRFTLSTDGDMGFPTKDGFWVTLDGAVEFRVMPKEAARVLVLYNDAQNDVGGDIELEKDIIDMVIMPNARSFCRLRGSDLAGKDFISGETRVKFQHDFQNSLEQACKTQGIEIVQAVITKINPPQKIAKPVRDREIAIEQEKQYVKETEQQASEEELAMEKALISRAQDLVETDREIIKLTTTAEKQQEVQVIEAQQRLAVAQIELEAAADMAAAVTARGKADADVIQFQNTAEAAGWKQAVSAFEGNGDAYARYVLLQKLAPSFRRMQVNTADSPLMDIFRQYEQKSGAAVEKKAAAEPAGP